MTDRSCPCCGGVMYTKVPVYVDLTANEASVRGQAVKLTPRQAEVLHVLAEAFPRGVDKDRLINMVGGRYATENVREPCIPVHISHIRRALRPFGVAIECLWGRGYRLIEAPIAVAAE